MSWEAGEEAEDSFVGAPGVVSHQTASQPEPPVLRFLPVGFAVQVKQEALREHLAPGTLQALPGAWSTLAPPTPCSTHCETRQRGLVSQSRGSPAPQDLYFFPAAAINYHTSG